MDIWHAALALICIAAATAAARLQLRLTQARERVRSQAQALDTLRALQADVSDKFQALADDALRRSQRQFLDLAGEAFAGQREGASGDLKALLAPVADKFGEFGKKVDEIRKVGIEERQEMRQQLLRTRELLHRTREETTKLTTALAAPRGGGRWGEETLRNVLELAGMSGHCDFEQQKAVRTGEAESLRPDVIVRMPGGRHLVIDAKAPLSHYLSAAAETDADARERHLDAHGRAVRGHCRALARKAYWRQFETAPDFVAMFIPGENFFSEALKRDPALFDDAARDCVVIVTPATLVALAKAVAFGWRQEKAAQNAERAAGLGRELYKRLRVMLDRLESVGRNLNRTVDSHNKLVASIEGRVMPAARRFHELGLGDTAGALPETKATDTKARLPENAKEGDAAA